MADRLMWWLLLGYPVLFAVADDRSIYQDRPSGVDANPLGAIGLALQVGLAVLAAGLAISRLMADSRAGRKVPTLLPYLILYFGTIAAISVIKGEPGLAFGVLIAGVTLTAVCMTPEAPATVLLRIRLFLRLEVLGSLALGVLMPGWALVPKEHNSRAFFGLDSRLIGLTSGPNYMGAAAAVLFIIELFLPSRGRALRLCCGTGAATAAVWSQSRTGIGVMAMAVLLAALGRLLGPQHLRTLAKAFVWGPIIAMIVIPPTILYLMASRPDSMVNLTTGRVFVWKAVTSAVTEAPLFGITRDEFASIASLYTDKFEFSNAHNQMLESLSGGGIVVLVLLLLLLRALGRALIEQASTHLTPLALSFGVLGQLPFGTPLRVSGVSWNLVGAAILVLCTRPWSHPETLPAPGQETSEGSAHETAVKRRVGADRHLRSRSL